MQSLSHLLGTPDSCVVLLSGQTLRLFLLESGDYYYVPGTCQDLITALRTAFFWFVLRKRTILDSIFSKMSLHGDFLQCN